MEAYLVFRNAKHRLDFDFSSLLVLLVPFVGSSSIRNNTRF